MQNVHNLDISELDYTLESQLYQNANPQPNENEKL